MGLGASAWNSSRTSCLTIGTSTQPVTLPLKAETAILELETLRSITSILTTHELSAFRNPPSQRDAADVLFV